MSKMYYGQINMTELIDAMKEKHSAFKKISSKKTPGKEIILANVTMWENDQPDQYGNTISLQLNSREDAKALEGKVYIANLKLSVPKENPITQKDVNALNELDAAMNGIPSVSAAGGASAATSTFGEDDVPF